ncbi:S-layer homology domain-containing protein [Ruminiclostridium papyrosolvens]|uniref:S-layer protein n=1 Tax=Ruminiclostridium papyrosolvens C7 TaxID=1330534 RepID=U4R6X8_9FIRM|nr:S-layer homology domain-containing protein [Ruminiclostridium papyrosolvens]EPR13752.1 S-layer protein [Ruminiclostridium papyrosolvens C7]
MISNRGKKYHKFKHISKLAIMLAVAILMQSLVVLNTAASTVKSNITALVHNINVVTLNWNDNLTNEINYYLERSVDGGIFSTVSYTTANLTTFTDSTVQPGHIYTYRVKVLDSTYTTYVYTDEISIRTDEVVKPDSLTPTMVSSNQIDLKWTYPEGKISNTIIERRTEGSTSWSEVARVAAGQNTYSDKAIAAGIKYYYKVRSYSTEYIKSSAYPDEYDGSSAVSMLPRPSNLSGFALSGYKIQLKWQDVSFETAYIIERRASNEGAFIEVAVVPQNTTSYIDNVAHENSIYSYRIKALTGVTSSEYSDVLNVASTYLKPPSWLTAVSVDGKKISLSWQDLTTNETGFEIWRKAPDETDYTLYDTMGRNANSYIDLNVSPQKNYSYKVRAKINDNEVYSDFSNESGALTTPLSPPVNLSFNVISKTEVELTWDDTSSMEAGFIVEKKIGLLSQWYQISQLEPNTTKYNDKWISSTEPTFYRIKAFDRSTAVSYSNEVQLSLDAPVTPGNLQTSVISTNDVKLTWKDNSSTEEGFIIEAKQLYLFREIGRVDSNVTTFIYHDAIPGKTMTYRIRAVKGLVQSNPSNEVVTATSVNNTFSDLGSVSWAVEAINNLASRNVFVSSSNRFNPKQSISRGEYCAILVRSLGMEKAVAGRFADVTAKHKYYKEIMAAEYFGIISKDNNNKIYPDKLITREQAAVMLALALKIKGTPLPQKGSSTLKQFADFNLISDSSSRNIAAVCGAGIISGRKINGRVYLQPSNNVTRAEAALMAYKGLIYNQGNQ